MLFTEYAKAVYSALKNDAQLASLVNAIGERIDDETAWPRIWLDDRASEDWSTKDSDGVQESFDLHIGSRADSSGEIRGIMDRVHTILHNAQLSLPVGVQCVLCQFDRHVFINEQDGKTKHGVMTFLIIISED